MNYTVEANVVHKRSQKVPAKILVRPLTSFSYFCFSQEAHCISCCRTNLESCSFTSWIFSQPCSNTRSSLTGRAGGRLVNYVGLYTGVSLASAQRRHSSTGPPASPLLVMITLSSFTRPAADDLPPARPAPPPKPSRDKVLAQKRLIDLREHYTDASCWLFLCFL